MKSDVTTLKSGSFQQSNNRVKVTTRVSLFTILLLALLLPFSAPFANEKAAEPAMTVTVEQPKKVNWPITTDAFGVISPWEEAVISTQIGGYQLVDVFVNVGDIVKKGQLVARLNNALLLADQTELIANVEQAEANLKRVKALEYNKVISEQDVLQAETQTKIANALLSKNKLQLKYTDILAPDDGVISSKTATIGTVTSVGQELFKMIRQARLEWRGEITAQQYINITIGQNIVLNLPNGKKQTATVRQKSPSFDSTTQLATLYADIASNDHAIAGMYVSGSIVLGAKRAFVVPAKSVIIRDGRHYILTIETPENNAKVSLHQVKIGRHRNSEVEILTSLKDVAFVVVDGAGFLSDGDVVRVAANKPLSEAR